MKVVSLGVALLIAAIPLNSQAESANYKDGFTHLVKDPKVLSNEEFTGVVDMPKTVALYFDGDRLHRKVPKNVSGLVEDLLTMKLVSSDQMKVAECADCRKTRVLVLKDAIRVETPASSREEFTALGETVGADAFMMWEAKETNGEFNIALRMVDARKGSIIWAKEYSKEISQSDVDLGYSEIDWRLSVGTWGLGSVRKATEGGSDATLSGITSINIDRKMLPWDNDGISYSFGYKYFKNTSGAELFDLTGHALSARVFMDMGRFFNRVPYSIYFGVGNLQYNDSRGFMIDFGVEIPFSNHGYMSLGGVQVAGDQITWEKTPGFHDSSEFGGIAYDFTIGINF